MNDKLKIKIPIANRVYPMIIEPSKEQGLRLASQKINDLIKKFEQNYSVQDKQDALAMCALQIASSRIQKKIDNDETLDIIEIKINDLIDIFDKNI
mgnify:FL=1